MTTLLAVVNLHKLRDPQKILKSHVIKFQVLNLITNQHKTKRKVLKYLIQKSMHAIALVLQTPFT
jgi:stress-induced morphogen